MVRASVVDLTSPDAVIGRVRRARHTVDNLSVSVKLPTLSYVLLVTMPEASTVSRDPPGRVVGRRGGREDRPRRGQDARSDDTPKVVTVITTLASRSVPMTLPFWS